LFNAQDTIFLRHRRQDAAWLIAFAIVAMLVIGWTMMNIAKDNPWRFGLFQFHNRSASRFYCLAWSGLLAADT